MTLARLAILAAIITGVVTVAAYAEATYPFYPCTTCHAAMKLTGLRKTVPFHDIDLTKGAHRGLYCSNCHVPPLMQNLTGGAQVYIPGVHSRDKLMETNKVCMVCHPREYMDYVNLVHGNKTFTCSGGSVEYILGYKGVIYPFHVCKEYKNLEAKPARACVECHDPHTPTYYALKPLPTPSFRPSPPPQPEVVAGTVLAGLTGLALIIAAFASRR